jgi:hypothetical protein
VGYTTEFEGEFHCYRAETEGIANFLQAVYQGDWAAVAVFADWLSEQNDPRGERIARRLAKPAETLAWFWRLFGLKPEHAAYLNKFNRTRRMRREPAKAKLLPDPAREAVGLPLGEEAAYFVGGGGFHGQERDDSVLDYNRPPKGQPGLWCKWRPKANATAIVWDRGEKFYHYVEWLKYLVGHFLAPWGYVLNGEMKWRGKATDDVGTLLVKDNRVLARPGH